MAEFTQEADDARAELEARGAGLTDVTPVLRCRAAIERLQVAPRVACLALLSCMSA